MSASMLWEVNPEYMLDRLRGNALCIDYFMKLDLLRTEHANHVKVNHSAQSARKRLL